MPPIELSTPLLCYRCGYDVRAQLEDGNCPECGSSVAESRRMSKIPRRPAWRDSDPRWRRRMLAGVWLLVLVPLVAVLQATEWDQSLPMPTYIQPQGAQALNDSFLEMVYACVVFSMGVVLLFSHERDRPPSRLDWTQRWGVVVSYGVLLLGAIDYAAVTALVTVGVGALCQSLPLHYQPAATDWIVTISTGYLRYGPFPGQLSYASLAACSAIAVLLGCVPLYNALRSCEKKKAAAVIVLAPLAISAVAQIGFAIEYLFLDYSFFARHFMNNRLFFFYPRATVGSSSSLYNPVLTSDVVMEVIKWLACLVIAVWLSIAQIRSTRSKK
jgi:hypothetical protein